MTDISSSRATHVMSVEEKNLHMQHKNHNVEILKNSILHNANTASFNSITLVLGPG